MSRFQKLVIGDTEIILEATPGELEDLMSSESIGLMQFDDVIGNKMYVACYSEPLIAYHRVTVHNDDPSGTLFMLTMDHMDKCVQSRSGPDEIVFSREHFSIEELVDASVIGKE